MLYDDLSHTNNKTKQINKIKQSGPNIFLRLNSALPITIHIIKMISIFSLLGIVVRCRGIVGRQTCEVIGYTWDVASKTVDAISSSLGGDFSIKGILSRLWVGPSTQISRISISNPCEAPTWPNAFDIFRVKYFILCDKFGYVWSKMTQTIGG